MLLHHLFCVPRIKNMTSNKIYVFLLKFLLGKVLWHPELIPFIFCPNLGWTEKWLISYIWSCPILRLLTLIYSIQTTLNQSNSSSTTKLSSFQTTTHLWIPGIHPEMKYYAGFRLTCRLPHCRFDDDIRFNCASVTCRRGMTKRQAASSQ